MGHLHVIQADWYSSPTEPVTPIGDPLLFVPIGTAIVMWYLLKRVSSEFDSWLLWYAADIAAGVAAMVLYEILFYGTAASAGATLGFYVFYVLLLANLVIDAFGVEIPPSVTPAAEIFRLEFLDGRSGR